MLHKRDSKIFSDENSRVLAHELNTTRNKFNPWSFHLETFFSLVNPTTSCMNDEFIAHRVSPSWFRLQKLEVKFQMNHCFNLSSQQLTSLLRLRCFHYQNHCRKFSIKRKSFSSWIETRGAFLKNRLNAWNDDRVYWRRLSLEFPTNGFKCVFACEIAQICIFCFHLRPYASCREHAWNCSLVPFPQQRLSQMKRSNFIFRKKIEFCA